MRINKLVKGKGVTNEALAIIEMICRALDLALGKNWQKVFSRSKKRGKKISIENLGSICEGLGCQTQIGTVKLSI